MRRVNPDSKGKNTHTHTEQGPFISSCPSCVCVSGEGRHTQFMKSVRRRSSLVGCLLVSEGNFMTRG